MVGKTIGKYRILETVGRGGMGTVYRAVDETLDRAVAIKALNPGLAEDDQVRRFHAEAVTLARVSHPNIATVYELVRDGDQLMMVMEFVSGETIERLLDRTGALPIGRAAALVAQTLDALSHAHRAGIVHRDLKPANLMLTEYGGVKVTDFGIARVRGTERMTTDGLLVGTPAYMAPEQVRGEDVDGRTDLYAVGVVFYRMVTGGLPFAANTPVAMIHAQLQDAPLSPRTLRPDLPAWLESVLMKALAKSPADRYQTAELFRAALTPANVPPPPGRDSAVMPDEHDLDVTVRPGQTPVRSAALPPTVTTTPATGTASPPTIVLDRLHIAFAGVVVALLLVIIGVLAWVALRSRSSPSPVAPAAASAPAASAPAATSSAPLPPARPPSPPTAAAPSPAAPLPSVPAAPERRSTLPVQPPPAAASGASAVPPEAPSIEAPAALATEPPVARGERFGPPGQFARRGSVVIASPAGPIVSPVETLVGLGGRGRLLPSRLTFAEQQIDVANPNNGVTVRSIPYGSVQHVTASPTATPRGAGGVELPIPIPARGNVEGRGAVPRLWLVLEAGGQPLVLRLTPAQVLPVLGLVRERIKAPIERLEEPGRGRGGDDASGRGRKGEPGR